MLIATSLFPHILKVVRRVLYSSAVGVGVYIVETKPNIDVDTSTIILHYLRLWFLPRRRDGRDLW